MNEVGVRHDMFDLMQSTSSSSLSIQEGRTAHVMGAPARQQGESDGISRTGADALEDLIVPEVSESGEPGTVCHELEFCHDGLALPDRLPGLALHRRAVGHAPR